VVSRDRGDRANRALAASGPEPRAIDRLRRDAASCRNCELWERATQTVFGRGPGRARVMLVGEQPGDAEDRQGEPFVGPAGRVLREALAEAGLDPAAVYVTNAVKHFYWEERGKRRIHKKPRQTHVNACRPWLEAEVHALKPAVIVCLGSVAAQAVIGPQVRVTRDGGVALPSTFGIPAFATIHPSAVLRAPDREARAAGRARLAGDLRAAAAHVSGVIASASSRPATEAAEATEIAEQRTRRRPGTRRKPSTS
jgi:DNA polymerase